MHRSDEQLPEVEAHREQRPEAPVDDDEVVLAVAHEDVLHAGVAVGVGLRQPVELAEHGQRQLDLVEQGGPQVEVARGRQRLDHRRVRPERVVGELGPRADEHATLDEVAQGGAARELATDLGEALVDIGALAAPGGQTTEEVCRAAELVGRPGPGAFVDELGPEADVVVVELLVVAELRHAHALRQHVGDARQGHVELEAPREGAEEEVARRPFGDQLELGPEPGVAQELDERARVRGPGVWDLGSPQPGGRGGAPGVVDRDERHALRGHTPQARGDLSDVVLVDRQRFHLASSKAP